MSLQLETEVQDPALEAQLSQLDRDEAELDKQLEAQGSAQAGQVQREEETPEENAELGTQNAETGKQAAATGTAATKTEATPQAGKAGTEEGSKGVEGRESKVEGKDGKAAGEPTKYEKERQRREKSWQALNAEKETFSKEKAEFERVKSEAAATAAAEPEYTPEQYENAAALFEKQGQVDLAEQARAEAKRLRETPALDASFKAAQKTSFQKALKRIPGIGVQGSPEHKRMADFINANAALFQTSPAAFEVAAELISAQTDLDKHKTEASRVPELLKQVESLTKEVETLRKATTPGKGGRSGAGNISGEKSFEQMSAAEQDAEMRRLAAEADRL